MSRRFGRQQKRKMRARIEALESAARLHRRYQQIVEETAAVLGRHFITLDPERLEVRHLDALGDKWRVAVASPLRAWDYSAAPEPAALVERVLPLLRGSVMADELRGRTHIQFTYSGKKVAYAITEEALAAMPQDMAIDRIAKNMAQYLYHSLFPESEGGAL